MGWRALLNDLYDKMEESAGESIKHDLRCPTCSRGDECIKGRELSLTADEDCEKFESLWEDHPDWTLT